MVGRADLPSLVLSSPLASPGDDIPGVYAWLLRPDARLLARVARRVRAAADRRVIRYSATRLKVNNREPADFTLKTSTVYTLQN